MVEIEFTFEGEIVPKGRPKFTRINGYPRAYTPKKTADYEKFVSTIARAEMLRRGLNPLPCPLSVSIDVFLPVPKSTSKKKRFAMLKSDIRPTVKPDIDNAAKSILDGMNGVVFDDDKQIVNLNVRKFYGNDPRVEVRIFEIEEFIP